MLQASVEREALSNKTGNCSECRVPGGFINLRTNAGIRVRSSSLSQQGSCKLLHKDPSTTESDDECTAHVQISCRISRFMYLAFLAEGEVAKHDIVVAVAPAGYKLDFSFEHKPGSENLR